MFSTFVSAVVYVVDSTDRDRIEQCREKLEKLLCENEGLKTSIVLVFANKQV